MSKGQRARYWKQYELDRARGVDRSLRDAAPVRELIERLMREQGLLVTTIAVDSGVSKEVILNVLGGQPRVRAASYDKLMHFRLTSLGSGGLLPAVGSRRRLQALCVMGHREIDISAALRRHGTMINPSTLTGPDQRWVTRKTARAVVAVYDELGTRPGPSARSAGWARAKGWVSALAWDDDTIDDPQAQPIIDAVRLEISTDDFLQWVQDQLDEGLTPSAVIELAGIQRDSFLRRLNRLGAGDELTRRFLTRAPTRERLAS